MEQRRNVGGNREEAGTTLGGLVCVGCSFLMCEAVGQRDNPGVMAARYNAVCDGCEISRSVRWTEREIIWQCESDHEISRGVRQTDCKSTRQCESDREISRGVRWMDCEITQQCESDCEISRGVRQTARYHAVRDGCDISHGVMDREIDGPRYRTVHEVIVTYGTTNIQQNKTILHTASSKRGACLLSISSHIPSLVHHLSPTT